MLEWVRTILLLASLFGLAACVQAAPRADPAASADTVDYSCRVDADCAVKDVGNCCGRYDACVNRDSPTFPDQVRADCAKHGMAGVCGFPVIAGCACIEGRCSAADRPAGVVR
ncbi:MAG TPA: hypothetical protein VF422_08025 [Dokdonella sp.]